jgi:hypothetical protein
LIESGADVNYRKFGTATILMEAAQRTNDPALIMALLDAGADTKAKYRGRTALDFARDNESLVNTDAFWRLNDLTFGPQEIVEPKPDEQPVDPDLVELSLQDLGRPISLPGLSLRTVRPQLSTVDQGGVKNPTVEIEFRKNGNPLITRVVRSTGNVQADIHIRKALYNWRASGPRLDALPSPEAGEDEPVVTVVILIRL